MVSAKLDELPAALIAMINRPKFQEAFHLPERGRYVARHVLPDGRREELEYDEALGRCLTLEERTAELPPGRTTARPDENVTVSSTYFIDPATSQLRLLLEVIDDTGGKLVSTTRLVHVPTPWNEDEQVNQALARRNFPAVYAAWPRDEQIAHWAGVLHRYRRARGESGRDEDEIYTPELVRDLERVDPRLRDLLPEILAVVGQLEQTPAAQAIAAFETRTGIKLAP